MTTHSKIARILQNMIEEAEENLAWITEKFKHNPAAMHNLDKRHADLAEAIKLVEELSAPDAKEGQASGWIRASERRPRLGQRVLVCSGDGIVQDETFTYNRDDSNFDFWDRDEIDGILVSEDDLWMPKPAAPAPEAQKGKE